MESKQKFHQLHYNFVAKRIRNNYPNNKIITPTDVIDQQAGRRVVEDIALEFAQRFKEDNHDFDQYEWLDKCSPDPETMPFSELWEERYG